jgi:hypothetical protein
MLRTKWVARTEDTSSRFFFSSAFCASSVDSSAALVKLKLPVNHRLPVNYDNFIVCNGMDGIYFYRYALVIKESG